jgi:hypothetical protein
MKIFLFNALIICLFAACTSRVSTSVETTGEDTLAITPEDTLVTSSPDTTAATVYANQRFRNVTVTRTDESTFTIKGQGQIFEANFGWVIEDGHEELQTGHQMTDAGAPEWGNFSFTVTAQKRNPNTTLHIILFESSAMDGSRQHELPVLLY